MVGENVLNQHLRRNMHCVKHWISKVVWYLLKVNNNMMHIRL